MSLPLCSGECIPSERSRHPEFKLTTLSGSPNRQALLVNLFAAIIRENFGVDIITIIRWRKANRAAFVWPVSQNRCLIKALQRLGECRQFGIKREARETQPAEVFAIDARLPRAWRGRLFHENFNDTNFLRRILRLVKKRDHGRPLRIKLAIGAAPGSISIPPALTFSRLGDCREEASVR